MTTDKRMCILTHTVEDDDGKTMTVRRGKEYTTSSADAKGTVIVFGAYWAPFPGSVFAGERRFT